jgi:ribosomal small subunit protein bTHX
MGKGDKRTRRGKIFVGSFGKTRPKHKGATVIISEPKPVVEKPAKKRTAKVVKAAAEAPPPVPPVEETAPAPEPVVPETAPAPEPAVEEPAAGPSTAPEADATAADPEPDAAPIANEPEASELTGAEVVAPPGQPETTPDDGAAA